MKAWKILRDYRRRATTLHDAASGIAHLTNLARTAWPATPRLDRPHPEPSCETAFSRSVVVLAAVDVQALAGNRPSQVRGQEQHRVGDVVGLGQLA